MTDRPAIPASADPVSTTELLWEQTDLPARAVDRGGLTPSDVPTPFPVAATSLSPADQLLAADPERLSGYLPAPLADLDRVPAEVHALSCALACPDLFLTDADSGPDQLRFAAELAIEASRTGDRVLVVVPTSADADAVLARLTTCPGLLVGRALAGYEHPDRLPAASAARTARAHRDGLLAELHTRSTSAVIAAEARLAELKAAQEAITGARAAANRLADLTAEETRLTHSRTDREASLQSLADIHAAALGRFDAEAQKLAAELESKRKELTAHHEHAASLGKRSGGVLGLFKGMFSSRPAQEAPELAAQTLEQEIARLESDAARVATERAQVDENYRASRDYLLGADLEARLIELNRERLLAEADFRREVFAFDAAGLGNLSPSRDAVDQVEATLPALVEKAEAELIAAHHQAADPGNQGPAAAYRVLARVRVVVATFDSVGADPLTLPPEGPGPAFGLLVLTDADRLNETGFAHAARSAARWVLVGDAIGPRGRPGRPSLFRRLWRHLYRESWAHEAGRLVALLQDAAPDSLTCEPLADRPEVELRFTHTADSEPVLAEVVFPSTTTVAEAKTFLASELGEIRLSPCGPVHWHEQDDRLLVCWPATDSPHCDWADLAPGIREKVAGTGADCRTAAVSFERSAGWDRETAERWLADRTGPGSRTAVLPRPAVIAPAPTRLAAGVPG